MKTMKKYGMIGMCGVFLLSLNACAPEIGSKAWCQQIKEKPKSDLTANEAVDYAKHCIFK